MLEEARVLLSTWIPTYFRRDTKSGAHFSRWDHGWDLFASTCSRVAVVNANHLPLPTFNFCPTCYLANYLDNLLVSSKTRPRAVFL